MAYTLSFRIRKIYYDQIVRGEKKVEVRAKSFFWAPRVRKARFLLETGQIVSAVFVCGSSTFRTTIVNITEHRTATEALGREPSEQGKKDCGDGPVYGFHIGGSDDENEK